MKENQPFDTPFNKPFLCGNELEYIQDAVLSGKISGNGKYTQKCQSYFENNYDFGKCLMTTSCTDALEMAAILCQISFGDEVILPSFTFVSTANAFALRGAKLVFADSQEQHPNIDVEKIEQLITPKTKTIVIVHYAGIACDMDKLLDISERYSIPIIEDAAQAIDSFHTSSSGLTRALGSLGTFSTFSFHETKNIISGEGGMLVINRPEYYSRAEIIWEKGTNRSAFFRGEVAKYSWVDIGSSFLPSEITSAFLYAQLESLRIIQERRKNLWNHYQNEFGQFLDEFEIQKPIIPEYSSNNAHIYYLICKDAGQRETIIQALRRVGIHSVFHYQSLHNSPYYSQFHDGRALTHSDNFSDRLLRLPLFFDLDFRAIELCVETILKTLRS